MHKIPAPVFRNRFLSVVLLWILFTTIGFSQGELNCNVTIDAGQVEANSQDKDLLNEVKSAITNFMNTRRWTGDTYSPEERIRCNLAISITSINGLGSYEATAQVQSSRPVYGGSYESILFNFFDKEFNFTYQQGMPLDFNENIYTSELSSLLGFYANIIIGMDYDSFSKLGGTPYFDKARNIVANISNPVGGWKPLTDPNNRAGLSENLNNQLLVPMREAMYTYHRLILDQYLKSPEENYAKLLEILSVIKQFNNAKRPNAIAVKSFFNAKLNELISMFSQAPPEVKKKAIDLLGEMDPSNTQKYQKIMANN
jgi:hypothetical protein